MRIFIIGSSPIGVNWIGRLVEELTQLSLSTSSRFHSFDDSCELTSKPFEDFTPGIWILESTSANNVKGLLTIKHSTDKIIVITRPIEDVVCEMKFPEGLPGMTYSEELNFHLEKNPFTLLPLVKEISSLNVKIYAEKVLNINYDDLCLHLDNTLSSLIKFLSLEVTKDSLNRIKTFCNLKAIKHVAAINNCGSLLLDEEPRRKIDNIKRILTTK